MSADAATAPAASRAIATAVLIGAGLCVLAVHRQDAREELRAGGTPSLEAIRPRFGAPPRGLVAPRPPSPTAPTSPAPPMPGAPMPGAPMAGEGTAPQPGSTLRGAELESLAVETFGEARPALVACLREERLERPDAAGKLPVALLVDAAGLVVSVVLGPSPLRGPRFDECATLSLATLVFPAEVAGRELTITFDLQ